MRVRASQPIAGEGGITSSSPAGARNPYEALEDLMLVVEALCPNWPPRDTFKTEGLWLL
jgi:hypothetical protein